MTFEEFFKKKKIDLPALEKAEGRLFFEFKGHFEQMGEKSFDHTKKYWFNKLRGQFPLAPEVKVEKVRIENPLAEQTIIETLEEVAQKASPKPGFTPRFKAASAPKPAEENTEESATLPPVTTAPKPGFTPRFKAATPPKVTEENTETTENTAQIETKEPASTQPKPGGFTPRFKAAAPPKKVEEVTEEKAAEAGNTQKSESTEQPKEPVSPQAYKPRFKPGMLPKKPEE